MAGVISSLVPFPNLSWWLQIAEYNSVLFDQEEMYNKMTYRNRYYIPGANGLIQLSIPISEGRNVRKPVKDILISNTERWQVQQWRTIVSVYRRTPYFEFYENSLQSIFETKFFGLTEFNLASIEWLKKNLKLKIDFNIGGKEEDITKLVLPKPGIERKPEMSGFYMQIFEDRNGFLPNMSMLDLLFSEGPYAMQKLLENKQSVYKWLG